MLVSTPRNFKEKQERWLRLRFTVKPAPYATNEDLILVLKKFTGKVYLEVIIGDNLVTIELKKYKFIDQIKRCGVNKKCNLSIASYDYENETLILNQLHLKRRTT